MSKAADDFKREVTQLSKDIDQYKKKSGLISPYTILASLAKVLMFSAPIIKPEIKIVGIALEWGGKLLEFIAKDKTKNKER